MEAVPRMSSETSLSYSTTSAVCISLSALSVRRPGSPGPVPTRKTWPGPWASWSLVPASPAAAAARRSWRSCRKLLSSGAEASTSGRAGSSPSPLLPSDALALHSASLAGGTAVRGAKVAPLVCPDRPETRAGTTASLAAPLHAKAVLPSAAPVPASALLIRPSPLLTAVRGGRVPSVRAREL